MRRPTAVAVLFVAFAGHAWAGAFSCTKMQPQNFEGCPFNKDAAEAHGRLALEKFPIKTERQLIRFGNSQTVTCEIKVDHVVAVYSKYSDGGLYFLSSGHVMHVQRIDRVFLRDLLDGKAGVRQTGAPECRPARPNERPYMPPLAGSATITEPNSSRMGTRPDQDTSAQPPMAPN